MDRFEDYLQKLERELPHIEVAQLNKLMDEKRDILLVDVRESGEYEQGLIPGSINLPRAKLEAAMASPGQTVVAHCGGRGRSQLVCASLREMGIDCLVLRGGYPAWTEAD